MTIPAPVLVHPICAATPTLHMAMRVAFSHWFGLERGTAHVLAALYLRRGEPAQPIALAKDSDTTPATIVGHHLHRLRQALNTEAIDYSRGAGYSLTEDGMAECRAVLWGIGEELRRVS